MSRRSVRSTVRLLGGVLASTTLLLGLVACGSEAEEEASVGEEVQACRDQWGDVAQGILDMDTAEDPSALSERWSTVIAGVDYQQSFATGDDCVGNIEDQVKAIDALRKLGSRLEVYDMEHQLGQIRPQAELYLNEPLPKPYRNENGKRVEPPTKAEVRAALQALEANAELSNQQLAPAWAQANAVDLTSPDSVRNVIKDIDRLATSSPAFRASEQALQVLVAAAHAQLAQ